MHADPTVWDTIFASPVVIAAARVVILSAAAVLLFGGLYIAISILHRMRHGQWLRRAGPFGAHLATDGGLGGADSLLIDRYTAAVERNEVLTAALVESDRELWKQGSMQTKHFYPPAEKEQLQ